MSKKKRKQAPPSTAMGGSSVETKAETTAGPAASIVPASKPAFPESPEPTAAKGSTPVLLLTLLGVLLYWGDMYVMENGADLMGKTGAFPPQIFYPYKTYAEIDKMHPKTGEGAVLELGEIVYRQKAKCDACHQPAGQGSPGQFPPLAGSDWVLASKPDRIIRIVLNGFTGPVEVSGQQYNNTMLPFRDILSDEDIANLLSFIRNAWGNKGSFVTPEQVKAIRDATADKGGYWMADELKAFPDQ
jgi:mono/diheme cytochrome c family protein